MRPWRDIFSDKTWADFVHLQKKTFSSKAMHDVEGMTKLIREYHRYPKDDRSFLPLRIKALRQISQAAVKHIVDRKVNLEEAKKRVVYSSGEMQPLKKHAATGHYKAGDPRHQSLGRNMLTLARRSLRKAKYLERLGEYCDQNSNAHSLMQQLLAPQIKTNDGVGLMPGVLMEKLDPWHRPVEILFIKNGTVDEKALVSQVGNPDDEDGPGATDFSMTMALAQWYVALRSNKTDRPFLLWLESHPACLADDKELISDNGSIAFLGSKGGPALPAFKVCCVFESGGRLEMTDYGSANKVPRRTADTNGYTCDSGKGTTDAAAFVWTGNEIMIGQHQGGMFHHSSFTSGGIVKCAGMIKITNGLISYVSNNSGHYRPGKALLARFVQHFASKGLVRYDCKLLCLGLKPDYSGLAKTFLDTWQTLT